jgi:hypothetical protein
MKFSTPPVHLLLPSVAPMLSSLETKALSLSHRRPSSGEHPLGTVRLPSPFSPYHGEPTWPVPTRSRHSGEPPPPPLPTVHDGPAVRRGPWAMSQVHAILLWKINPELENPRYNYKEPPALFQIRATVHKNSKWNPWIPKIFPDTALATFQKFQLGPYNFFSPYLPNHNSDFNNSCAQILTIVLSFISCIHDTCLLHID